MTRDVRNYQILFLSLFLYYGMNVLGWDLTFDNVLAVALSAVITQSVFALTFQLPINSLKSAFISSLALSILLRSNYNFVFVLAGFFAISSKFLFTTNKKHFFNPANFGIIVIVFFTGIAWITPSQWDLKTIIFFVSGMAGIMIISKIEKYDSAILYFLFYFILSYSYHCLYLHHSIQNVFNEFSNGSFLMLSFFMIIDPSTTPNVKIGRHLWIIMIVLISFYFYNFKYISVGAGIYALFIASIFTPVIDYFLKGNKFSWDSTDKSRKLYTNQNTLVY